MNQLATKEIQMTSVELAEITGKRHADLMRDIRGEVEKLGKEIAQRIFALGSYLDKNNQERPMYTFGRKGAMQLALKYDAKTRYKVIEKLEELEQGQALQANGLSPQLQLLINMELEQKKLQTELQDMREVIIINPKEEWRIMTQKILNKIGYKAGDYQKPKNDAYSALEVRAKCKLKIRLDNLRGRALSNGMARSKADALNYLDVIANDARLKEIYISIVKEMAIKYGVA
jgi:Rha family phage regulatory protein